MFRIPSMFKTPRHKQFEFKTRYYDADKEAFEERVRKSKIEAGYDTSVTESARMRVHKHFENRRNAKPVYSSRQSNLRIILITGLLGALIYWILK
jgi:hypothetical protein